MNREPRVEFDCAECGARVLVDAARATADCPRCSNSRELTPASTAPGGGLLGCRVCGHPELYTRKDFPKPLGFAIVIVAAVLAPFTNYISLGVAALLDFALYFTMPELVACYVCDARHRGFPREPHHPRFDREIDERIKYGKRAVMGKPMREGGTAGAPEPEH